MRDICKALLWLLVVVGLWPARADRLDEVRRELITCLGPIGSPQTSDVVTMGTASLVAGMEETRFSFRQANATIVHVTSCTPLRGKPPFPLILFAGKTAHEPPDRRSRLPPLPAPQVQLAELGWVSVVWSATRAESECGWRALARGETALGHEVAIAAHVLDLFLARPDIDAARVSVLAQGPEGWPLLVLGLLDSRVQVLACAGAVTTAAGIRAGAGYWPDTMLVPGLFARFDIADYVALAAPRPLLLQSGLGDNLALPKDVSQLALEAQITYRQLGATEAIAVQLDNTREPFGGERRRAVFEWLHAQRLQAPSAVLSASRCWDTAHSVAAPVPPLQRTRLQELLGPSQSRPPAAQLLDATQEGSLLAQQYRITASLGYNTEGYLLLPEGNPGPFPAIVCLHRWEPPYTDGKAEPAGMGGNPEHALGPWLARRGFAVLCPDALGHGTYLSPEIARDYRRDPAQRVQWPARAAIPFGSTAMRVVVDDVSQWVSFLQRHPAIDPERIAVLGDGVGGVCALFAAACDTRIAGVAALDLPSVVDYCTTALVPVVYIPGLERAGGLSAVVRIIAPRPVWLATCVPAAESMVAPDPELGHVAWIEEDRYPVARDHTLAALVEHWGAPLKP